MATLAVLESKLGRQADAERHVDGRAGPRARQRGRVAIRRRWCTPWATGPTEAIAALQDALKAGYSRARAGRDPDLAALTGRSPIMRTPSARQGQEEAHDEIGTGRTEVMAGMALFAMACADAGSVPTRKRASRRRCEGAAREDRGSPQASQAPRVRRSSAYCRQWLSVRSTALIRTAPECQARRDRMPGRACRMTGRRSDEHQPALPEPEGARSACYLEGCRDVLTQSGRSSRAVHDRPTPWPRVVDKRCTTVDGQRARSKRRTSSTAGSNECDGGRTSSVLVLGRSCWRIPPKRSVTRSCTADAAALHRPWQPAAQQMQSRSHIARAPRSAHRPGGGTARRRPRSGGLGGHRRLRLVRVEADEQDDRRQRGRCPRGRGTAARSRRRPRCGRRRRACPREGSRRTGRCRG